MLTKNGRKVLKLSLAASFIIVLSVKAVLAQNPPDYVDTEIVINAGAIGAIFGVALRVYLKWKEKERTLKHTLKFEWRYGYIGFANIVIELLPTVFFPALALGAVFSTGDPVADFINGAIRGALFNELATIVLKHIRPPEG